MDDSLFRDLIEAAPDGLLLVDEAGRIVFANGQAEKIFGCSRDELIRRSVETLLPEGLRTIHADPRAAFDAVPGSKTPTLGRSVLCRRPDGAEFQVEVRLSKIETHDELYIMATVRDVSPRYLIDRTLRDAEERLRMTLDEAPIGMAMVGLDGRFLRVNRSLCQIVGYTPEELTGLTFQSITHSDDLSTDLAMARQLERGEIPNYKLAKRYIRKDGSIVDIMLNGSIVRDAEGSPLHYIAQIEDITDRKRAEDALRQSEARYRALIEQAPDGIFLADLSGRYIDVNSAACRMLGYTRDELLSKTIMDLIPQEDVSRLIHDKELMLNSDTSRLGEWKLKRNDGVFIPVEVITKILPDGRWQAFVRDISERKRTEDALRRSEESLARAQSIAQLGSWDWDLRSNKVIRSAQLFALYGLKPDSKYELAKSLMELVHPEDREKLNKAVSEAVRTGQGYSVEYRLLREDGTERIALSQGEVLSEEGQAVRMVGTVMDITERKRLEREREESLRWLHTVIEQCPAGIMLVQGAHGARVEFNKRAQSLIGLLGGHLKRSTDLVLRNEHGQALSDDCHPSTRALCGERLLALELTLCNADGALIPILLDAAPLVDEFGGVQGAVVVFQDITLIKQLERLRAEWSAVVAHDLRQPLNIITLVAQMLGRRQRSAAELKKPLEQIIQAARRLHRMTNDLLDYGRIEARKLTLTPTPVDLAALIRTSVGMVELEAPDRHFEVRILSSPLTISVDADRIAQVVENLLSNAVKYGEPETTISIDVETGDKEVMVAITNVGSGIAPEDLPHLFQRFLRTEEAQRGPQKGVGLGLYIVRELIEAHNGRIQAESTPGQTTTFRFTLPRTDTASAARSSNQPGYSEHHFRTPG